MRRQRRSCSITRDPRLRLPCHPHRSWRPASPRYWRQPQPKRGHGPPLQTRDRHAAQPHVYRHLRHWRHRRRRQEVASDSRGARLRQRRRASLPPRGVGTRRAGREARSFDPLVARSAIMSAGQASSGPRAGGGSRRRSGARVEGGGAVMARVLPLLLASLHRRGRGPARLPALDAPPPASAWRSCPAATSRRRSRSSTRCSCT